MASSGLIWATLAAALIGAALCQDGLSCTNVGQTWHHQCNTCSCRENVIICTKDRCSGTDRNPITSASCLAGSKWQDGCGDTCLCDPSGKRRCTVGACPPRVRSDSSMTFIRTTGDACAAGDTWSVDCRSCSCEAGRAVCSAEKCPRRPPPEPITCEPGERWEDECGNQCECSEHGVAACTMLLCEPGQRAGVRRRPILRSGDSCDNQGDHWQQDCNECDCVSGVVSCTRHLCATGLDHQKYGKCQLNTRWVDECDNQCHCTVRGVPACTLKECPYGRKEGVQSHFLLEDGATCSNEGEEWQQGCSRCQCSTGRVSCSHRACPALTERTVLSEPEWMNCREDTTWEDECGNICSCWNGEPLCTRMGCPKGRTAGKPVKFIMFDGDACYNEGDTWKDDCNTCSCTNGAVECTKKFCKQQRQSVRFVSPFMAMSCTPGKRWIDECDNTCFCPDTGHSACTMMACPPGKRPMVPVRYIQAHGDTCTEEGSSWRHECNTCSCTEGRVACTKRRCRQQLLRSTVLSVRGVAGPASDKQCEEKAEWTDECGNHCRCSPGGLVMCTTKVCAPGKQAGHPLQKRPKLGDPCEDGEDTWQEDCNTCQCVQGVTACTRETCTDPQQEVDGVPVQQCRPDSSWLDECDNQCLCSENGLSYCTLKGCPHGQQYGVPKKFVRTDNSTCSDEGATWRQDCNTCNCTDGRISCTDESCEPKAGITARFGASRGPRCVPGSKWIDQCENTCRCTSSGQPACSLKACAPGKKAGVPVEQLPAAGDRCDDEGTSWREDCNKCTCTEGVVRCTEQLCTPQELPTNDEGPCNEGEEWIDECTNRCKCIGGEPRCTRRPCPGSGQPGVPARFVVPDGDSCDNEGERWQEDCNTCHCEDGLVSCTKEPCVGLERGGGTKKPGNCPYVPPGTLAICINGCNGDDMCDGDEKCCSNGCGAMCMKPDSCLEGISWVEECNECDCLNGEPVCTNKICAKNEILFDQPAPGSPTPVRKEEECVEGSVWKKDCNSCDCIHGRAVCTKRICPSNPSPIYEVTGECREHSVWRKDCNRCRCIGGRAVCTMKICSTEPDTKPETDGVCRMPPVDLAKQKCTGFIRRWTFDFASGKCRRYVYGGCHGTQNLFRTRKQCTKRCRPAAVRTSRATACRLPVETGPCFDIIPRYFFDTKAGKCRQFGYSGCGENLNNFHTLDSCIGACGGTYTSKDSHCDRRMCPWSLYQYYTEQGCEPVYENQACCPTRFECPTIRESGPEKCKYRGREYSNGDPVPDASQLDPCKRSCQCISTPGDGARIDCAEVDCPASVWNQISAGCLPLYLPDRCCPVSVKCPSARNKRSTDVSLSNQTATCLLDGQVYGEGDRVPTLSRDPCYHCVCSGVSGRPDGLDCRRLECPYIDAEMVVRGCAPVHSSEQCCPVDWKCPEDMPLQRSQPTNVKLTEDLSSEPTCKFGSQRVVIGFRFDVNDKCTVCDCLTPPKLTCRKLFCPQITPQWKLPPGNQSSGCIYRERGPDACCPEVVCEAPVETPPVLSPGCDGKQCHLPAGRQGCSAVYRAGECCPQLECHHPPANQDPADVLQCEPVECAGDCRVARDQYGCPQCDCSVADVLAPRAGPVTCERQFCPVGCPSHYEHGCIVCDCDIESPLKRIAPTRAPTGPPCPPVACQPHCGYRHDTRDGCTVCDCPPTTTPTPLTRLPCVSVTCMSHCGYKKNSDGCTVCDCPSTTTPTPMTRPPCVSVTCMPHCGYKRDSYGCTVCDCPPTTTPMPPTPPPCVSVTCMPHCGYKTDSNGCTVCDCPPTPGPTTPIPFWQARFKCPPLVCACPHRPWAEESKPQRRFRNGCFECDCHASLEDLMPLENGREGFLDMPLPMF